MGTCGGGSGGPMDQLTSLGLVGGRRDNRDKVASIGNVLQVRVLMPLQQSADLLVILLSASFPLDANIYFFGATSIPANARPKS